MNERTKYKEAVSKLRGIWAGRETDEGLQKVITAKEKVLARYQPVFSLESIPNLTKEEFQDFLKPSNNHHWSGLHRLGGKACANMNNLRKALAILLDESKPIDMRLNKLIPKSSKAMVPYMGKAILTAILLIAYPDKYGVWNNTSQGGMQRLDIWPQFDWGAPFGKRYVTINALLLKFSRELRIDLWDLDALWWRVKPKGEDGNGDIPPDDEKEKQRFRLERHLHDFLRDNWSKTSIGRQWDLYEEDGEVVGYKYSCGVGEMDLLAKHKRQKRWLVIELKRDQSSDQTVAQLLRYMGWVRSRMAQKSDKVEGLIISHDYDEKLKYALVPTENIDVKLYEVDFRLKNL